MSYRILSCASCETRLRFLRDVERKSVICPDCGEGMELLPQNKVIHSEQRETADEPFVPPAPIQEIPPGLLDVPTSDAPSDLIHRLLIAAAMIVVIFLMMMQLRIL